MTLSDSRQGSPDSEHRHPVDLLAEEFASRMKAGECPQIEEYAAKYPEHAELIRSVFPSIAMVQRVSNRAEQQRNSGSSGSNALGNHGIPESLGDFRLVREIGRGGMGVVYEAIQISLKRRVALKVIGAIPSGSEKQQARFRREAEAAASLHHTHIVPVYGIGEDQGIQYYAMQLIDGVTLSEVIGFLQGNRLHPTNDSLAAQSQKSFSTAKAAELLLSSLTTPEHSTPVEVTESDPTERMPILSATIGEPAPTDEQLLNTTSSGSSWLPEKQDQGMQTRSRELVPDRARPVVSRRLGPAYYRNVAQIAAHVADGLQYAHHQGVLHRDIKPGNLLLDRDGIVWITDFGLARQTDCEGMTQTGEIVGTLRYMAPEQIRGQADQRTDVYSLGLTIFELLTLQPAIAQPQNRLDQAGFGQAIARLDSLNPEVPADLQTITLKACTAEPSHRYQSAAELGEDLRRFIEDRPILARRTTRIEHLYRWARRNPIVAGLSSATLVLLLSVASLLAVFNQRKQSALNAIRQQYDRAERNLQEKTDALATVEKERVRAELNLDLAVQAFDTVIANIASRGGSDSIEHDLVDSDDVLILADATLSDADVVLLETLLGFFDRFSAENEKDLSGKTAEARRRVGDIQHRLGRLDDAEQSYLAALEAFKPKPDRAENDFSLTFVQAEILNDLLVLAAKRGQMPRAIDYYNEARDLLEESEEIRNSTAGRFALAKTHNNLAAIGSRFNRESMPRPRGPFINRFPKPLDESMALMQRTRLSREANANMEALRLLQGLTSESPSVVAYQVAYAQALRDEVRIARMMNDPSRARESLNKAISIFERLAETYRDSATFKYELASTLNISIATSPNEISRFMRSMKLCDQLIEKHPNVAEYRALRGQTLDKLAMLQFSMGQTQRAEDSLRKAIEIHEKLAEQYPDVLLYQINLLQSIQRIAELHMELKRPDLAKQDIAMALSRFEKFQGPNRLFGPLQPLILRLRERQRTIDNTVKD